MIDAPDRKTPRFPPDEASNADAAITYTLAAIGTEHGDLAICGACGGDLLFAEACLARGMRLELYIPFDEPTFLANSVDFADSDWHDRYSLPFPRHHEPSRAIYGSSGITAWAVAMAATLVSCSGSSATGRASMRLSSILPTTCGLEGMRRLPEAIANLPWPQAK